MSRWKLLVIIWSSAARVIKQEIMRGLRAFKRQPLTREDYKWESTRPLPRYGKRR